MPILSHSTDHQNPSSLVSQLQQVHGMTKKKVYGTKPSRKPFVRDERVRPGLPDPLLLPTPTIHSHTTESGRVISNSKAARMSRIAQNSPTELHGRRPLPPRRSSQSSLPDSDVIPSSTSYSIPSTLATSIPASSIANVYDHQPIAPIQQSQTFYDPSWNTPQYNSIVPSISYNHFPAYSNSIASQSSEDAWRDQRAMSQLDPPNIPPQNSGNLYIMSSLQRPPVEESNFQIQSSIGSSKTSSGHPSRRDSCPEDDEPFTFNAEYVAATAALFKSEILPVYPELQPAFDEVVSPRSAFFHAQEQAHRSSSSYCPGELYASAERKGQLYSTSLEPRNTFVVADSSRPAYATACSSGSSSSLTGWAG